VSILPAGFEFECPLCRAATYGRAPQFSVDAAPALYKCGGCHFYFSDPTQYPKALAQLKSVGRTPTE
jgi:hypothetical protein